MAIVFGSDEAQAVVKRARAAEKHAERLAEIDALLAEYHDEMMSIEDEMRRLATNPEDAEEYELERNELVYYRDRERELKRERKALLTG